MATGVLAVVAVAVVECVLVAAAALMAVVPGVPALVAASIAERGRVLVSVESGHFVLALSVVAVAGVGSPAASVVLGAPGAVVAALVHCVLALVVAAVVFCAVRPSAEIVAYARAPAVFAAVLLALGGVPALFVAAGSVRCAPAAFAVLAVSDPLLVFAALARRVGPLFVLPAPGAATVSSPPV